MLVGVRLKSVSSCVYISARGPLVAGVDLSALLANGKSSKRILNLWSSFVNVNREKSSVAGVNFSVCNAYKKKYAPSHYYLLGYLNSF